MKKELVIIAIALVLGVVAWLYFNLKQPPVIKSINWQARTADVEYDGQTTTRNLGIRLIGNTHGFKIGGYTIEGVFNQYGTVISQVLLKNEKGEILETRTR